MTTGVQHNVRKVLVVAYTFPPIGGSGVQRIVKFAKYLPEFGWQPVILTVSNPPSEEIDRSLLQELPDGLSVRRAPDFNLVHLLRRMVRRLRSSSKSSNRKAGGGKVDVPASSRSVGVGRVRRAWRDFSETWLMIPDNRCYWLLPALWVGLSAVKDCDVIFSTSAPFTNHLVAYFLQKFSGKPWVADFRDPWTQYGVYQRPSSRLRSRVDAFFEALFLKSPDRVTVTCAATAGGFQRLYPYLPKEKFVEITNGFDAADFDQRMVIQSDRPTFDRFTIVYTGRFVNEKHSRALSFLEALRELCRDHPELDSEIQVIFAGRFGEQGDEVLKRWELEEVVQLVGYVPHAESVKLLLKSHVLLLTLNDAPGTELLYPGKLFEYLAAGQTILALVPEGATADLVRDMGAGLVVPPDDVEAIKRAVFGLYNQHKQGNMLSRIYDDLQRFERRTLTRRLAQCLEGVLEGDRSTRSPQA
jgi:glycosyltransferase involved in cell wall biosynthesis